MKLQCECFRRRVVAAHCYTVVLVGLDGAGKTTLSRTVNGGALRECYPRQTHSTAPLRRPPESKPTTVLARDSSDGAVYDDPEPTIGFNPGKTERNGMSINLWDLGGGRRIRGVWESYVDEIHGAIYMVDGALPRRGLLVCRRCS